MSEIFSEAVVDIPEAQPLVEALAGVESLSVLSEVRLILSRALDLVVAKLDAEFLEDYPGLLSLVLPPNGTNPHRVINDLQIPLITTASFHGLMFGQDFLFAFQRAFAIKEYERSSSFVDESVQLIERHSFESKETGNYTTRDDLCAGSLLEYEDWIQAKINAKVTVKFGSFVSKTVDGNGSFYCALLLGETRASLTVHTVKFKVVKLVLHLDLV
ncbi:UNVERIFIED_CONTAM: hypothetical protein HDU68_003495, partial [Siphonaria sp. JEL0065]